MGERWKNQLGSVATLHFQPDGSVTGLYSTAVSSNGNGINNRPLQGTWQSTPEGVILVGWVAQWEVPLDDGTTRYSTTSWSGVLIKDLKLLDTTWILTAAGKPAWDRTNIGHDRFEHIEA